MNASRTNSYETSMNKEIYSGAVVNKEDACAQNLPEFPNKEPSSTSKIVIDSMHTVATIV